MKDKIISSSGGGLQARAGLGNGGPEAVAGLGGTLDGSSRSIREGPRAQGTLFADATLGKVGTGKKNIQVIPRHTKVVSSMKRKKIMKITKSWEFIDLIVEGIEYKK